MIDTHEAEGPDTPKRGRPTKYKPEYLESVIEWGKLGKSKAWMCAAMDITPETMSVWCDTNPNFSEAITRAVTYSQQWWEDAGQFGMIADKFNSNVWSRSMAARFPNDWRENTRADVNLGGQPNNPVLATVAITIVDPDT